MRHNLRRAGPPAGEASLPSWSQHRCSSYSRHRQSGSRSPEIAAPQGPECPSCPRHTHVLGSQAEAGQVCVHVALLGAFTLLPHAPRAHQTSLQSAVQRWNSWEVWDGHRRTSAKCGALLRRRLRWCNCLYVHEVGPAGGVCSSAAGSHETGGESSEDWTGGSSAGLGPRERLSKISASSETEGDRWWLGSFWFPQLCILQGVHPVRGF